MADVQSSQPSRTERFIRSAGEVREDPAQRLWAPARWVVQMIQYLVAIIMYVSRLIAFYTRLHCLLT